MSEWTPFKILMKLICDEHDVTELDLKSASRLADHARARGELCWLVKSLTDMKFASIGRSLGGRDHSTIHTAISKVQRTIDENADYGLKMGELRSRGEAKISKLPGRTLAAKPNPDEVVTTETLSDPLVIARRILSRSQSTAPLNTDEMQALAQFAVTANAELKTARGLAQQVSGLMKNFGGQ